MEQSNISQSNPSGQGFNLKDFLSFRTMITLLIMQIVYGVGAVLITLFALSTMFRGNNSDLGGYGSMMPGGFFMGLLILVIGNVFWRLWCEIIIVLFRMNRTLTNIEANTKK